jgi:outer membrane receptor protein involved in Fe transport
VGVQLQHRVRPEPGEEPAPLLNGRIGIGPEDKKWQFEIWGQNLTDERYYQVAFDAVFQTGSYDAFLGMPRTYGATVRFTY